MLVLLVFMGFCGIIVKNLKFIRVVYRYYKGV